MLRRRSSQNGTCVQDSLRRKLLYTGLFALKTQSFIISKCLSQYTPNSRIHGIMATVMNRRRMSHSRVFVEGCSGGATDGDVSRPNSALRIGLKLRTPVPRPILTESPHDSNSSNRRQPENLAEETDSNTVPTALELYPKT